MRSNLEVDGALRLSQSDTDLSLVLEGTLLQHGSFQNSLPTFPVSQPLPFALTPRSETSTPEFAQDTDDQHYQVMAALSKLARDEHDRKNETDLLQTLQRHGAKAAIVYHTAKSDPQANDIWPNVRNKAKFPACYDILDLSQLTAASNASNVSGTPSQPVSQTRYNLRSRKGFPAIHAAEMTALPTTIAPGKGRPFWRLPVELVELIVEYLDRDDIKSLRMVSRELNDLTSQAAFKTVVVPFNTEIYGMLGHEPGLDRKGKKRARISRPDYTWKNANGNEVYDGHGLDVFRGFGRHIVRYGMSFVVNEDSLDSLSAPPLKPATEQKSSFWGNYDWPYEEYRRFDAVAGLESAADETPRMKIAFAELTKVKELALSVNSGLGWLNGPDRSIRARVLQKSSSIFDCSQSQPDRRSRAQGELWSHIESMHAATGEDIRLASLYILDGARPMLEAQELRLPSAIQPNLPFVDTRILHEAIRVGSNESHSTRKKESGESFRELSTTAGVLFTSTSECNDDMLNFGPIKPSDLSCAQKEWLLETDWAQRAFMSSYMLSIIDNRLTFHSIHTLNISALSDRYISMLNRNDFWDALPSLKTLTLIVIPGWRTVEKDEAGYVEAPEVNPTGHVDTFCGLLQAQISPRSNISRLTVGYSASGEHAEGLYARNKLLMPAPVLPLKARLHSDTTFPPVNTVALEGAKILQQILVYFPYLEDLTLRNCWITPPSLLQFIKLHDACKLRNLALESLSLTAVLRTPGNLQPANVGPQFAIAQNAAAAVNNGNNNMTPQAPAAALLLGNAHMVNTYIQGLIGQLQHIQANAGNFYPINLFTSIRAQLQQHLQNAQALTVQQQQGNPLHAGVNPVQQNQQGQPLPQNFIQLVQLAGTINTLQNNIGQNAPAHAPVLGVAYADNTAGNILHNQPREGSWTDIIDQVSPGNNLSDFESPHSHADPNRSYALDSISFLSCGYAKLPHLVGFDQSEIEDERSHAGALRNAALMRRYHALSPVMMSSKWEYLGEIVQEVDCRELAVLDAAWNLRQGWDDAEAARAVQFDGLLSGGTGRFTGKVQRSDRAGASGSSAT